MTKRSFIAILLLLLTPILVFAQDSESENEDIAYLRLNSNFSVPEIRGWDIVTENETALFSRDDIQAQIYVRIVDTLNTTEAIDAAIADVEQIALESSEPILEGRIGRNNGTWNYRIFTDGDTSVTAYALLQSNQVYVVLFAEESPDYEAYHLAMRSGINDPATGEEISDAISPLALVAINSLFDADFSGEPVSTRNPVESNALWLESQYENGVTTASYFFLRENIVYITLVEGNSEIAAELSDAFDSIFLGFVITPDNSEFLRLGLIFSAVIMLTLLGSMFLRYQNLKKDMLVIEQLAEEE